VAEAAEIGFRVRGNVLAFNLRPEAFEAVDRETGMSGAKIGWGLDVQSIARHGEVNKSLVDRMKEDVEAKGRERHANPGRSRDYVGERPRSRNHACCRSVSDPARGQGAQHGGIDPCRPRRRADRASPSQP
jgi:hypothetical protein